MIAVFLAALATPQTPPDLRLPLTIETVKDGYTIKADGQPFATLVLNGTPKPYVYPLHGPSGAPVTRNFPMRPDVPGEPKDHPHHRSLWFAHGNINGHDAWHEGPQMAKAVYRKSEFVSDGATVQVTVQTTLEKDRKTFARQTLVFTFAATKNNRTVDLQATLAPEPPTAALTFGDTKEGTMAVRVRPELQHVGPEAKGKILNSEGHVGTEAWGKRARWVSFFGPVEGKTVGVALFDHLSNHAHPTWFHARDYGLLAANPFGQKDFEGKGDGTLTLKPGESLNVRYRVLLHLGDPQTAKVQDHYQTWAKS